MKANLDSKSLIAVAACDLKVALELGLPVTVLLIYSGKSLSIDGTEVIIEAIAYRLIGAMSFSEAGQEELHNFIEGWHEKVGSPSPKFINYGESPDSQEILREVLHDITELYSFKIETFFSQNYDLLQKMTTLRIAQEKTLSALAAAERFLLESIEKRRWQVQDYSPCPEDQTALFKLPSNIKLHQLLSASSMGMSDVSFMLADQEIPAEGSLTATLHLIETDHVIAKWVLAAADLSVGWQRLSLVCALDQDEQSVRLNLEWQGEGHIWIVGSIHHPDSDYCVKVDDHTNDRILAHQVWKYLPGSIAPMPENAHWIGGPVPKRFYIEPMRLANAVSANSEVDCLQYFQNLEALQVHPFEGSISAGCIAKGVPPLTHQISATVGGRSENGPNIEYALAAAPLHPRRELHDLVMDCQHHGRISDWLPLSKDAQGQLILNLRSPSENVSDLYLLTRLAPGARQQRGWATFRNIWLSA